MLYAVLPSFTPVTIDLNVLSIIIILAVAYYWNINLPKYLEKKYNETQNYNDLISLCRNLYGSKDYNKQIKYYSILIKEKETFINARKDSKDAEKEYSIYTVWYFKALLDNKNYKKYKNEFNKYFYKLENLDIVVFLYQDYISNKNFNQKALNTILNTNEENIEKLKIIEKPTKKEKNQYKTLQQIRYEIYKLKDENKAKEVLKEQNEYLENK